MYFAQLIYWHFRMVCARTQFTLKSIMSLVNFLCYAKHFNFCCNICKIFVTYPFRLLKQIPVTFSFHFELEKIFQTLGSFNNYVDKNRQVVGQQKSHAWSHEQRIGSIYHVHNCPLEGVGGQNWIKLGPRCCLMTPC